ncbi:tRNA epoxyqueuosine(34) reductase QueG [Prolixibacter sp. SD074]|jgi:epoxyqueuosine reductase|uniref:tRNA epoxyqueuosine(34) reductase QueG n=1 Tax=Prolixibacter sp. SD074 TaxID=2652391 RepID=UPI00127B2A09|nr:tRNA epoxyqueuosine(34) reductase QueG [Prolixibacter sp. SD074]GET30214.1 epoxyqueuosine reductase [Prolixibacter sp. SD074]
MSTKGATYSERIKAEAKRLGFTDCGIAAVKYLGEEEPRLLKWLAKGMNGQMGYMERNVEKRLDPGKLVEGARSVVSVILNYYPAEKQKAKDAPVISKYAYGTDYHFVIKDKLKSLLRFIQEEIAPCSGRPFIDSAPVLDRAWARHAGLGWIGKNSHLISPKHGSFFFIGELIIDLELDYDQPADTDFCGSCTRCIDACPTKAIVAPHTIDARKCISYLTIENREEIPEPFKGQLQNRMYGCDICQDVCPWNRNPSPHNVEAFTPKPELLEMTRADWKDLDRGGFNQLFRKSAVKRAGFKGLRRNIDFLD